jgi:arylsulfatase A-like enzyme
MSRPDGDEEETTGLLYQGASGTNKKKLKPTKFLLRRGSINPQAWKYAATWTFFTIGSVFLSLLVVKVISNNILSQYQRAATAAKTQSTEKLKAASQKPNFIFVLADDLGYGSINQAEYDFAPHLSTMGREGIIISNYYTQEVCAPSRASLLTGRYPARLGMQYGQLLPTVVGGLSLDATLLPEILKSEKNYKSYALGKWNLGHSSPDYLPTARGFDYYLGYLTTENTYWSKSMGELYHGIQDFLEASTKGYWPYTGDDMDTYSTQFYRNHAQTIIRSHDFSENPMFLYLAFQAAHPPYEDLTEHVTGLEEVDVSATLWSAVKEYTSGHHRQQYALSVALLDQAVQDIWDTVIEVGQADNTYLIFASDNGGCPQAGGSTGAFRGSKGTLFEGGVRVDAFVYHPSFKTRGLSRAYQGLMHVSDWFPSMMTLAGIDWPSVGAAPTQRIDGYSHADFWLSGSSESKKQSGKLKGSAVTEIEGPRDHVFYNYYFNVENVVLDRVRNASVAIRDQRYKLIRTFVDNEFDGWHNVRTDPLQDNDDRMVVGPQCTEDLAMASGTFTEMLFDLQNDPTESVNLISDKSYSKIKAQLEIILQYYESTISLQPYLSTDQTNAMDFWTNNGQRAQPWILSDSDVLKLIVTKKSDKK